MNRDEKITRILLGVLFLILVLQAVFFGTRYLFNWDAGQFALGTVQYDLESHQPHPPGYPAYVFSGFVLEKLVGDVNTAFLFVNIVTASFTVFFLFFVVREITNQAIAFWISFLFLVNPVTWFHNMVALTYGFEALAATFLTYATVRILKDDLKWVSAAFGVVGFLMGFRPSVLIISMPFLVWMVWQIRKKRSVLFRALLVGGVGLSIWLVPFFFFVGLLEVLRLIKTQLLIAGSTNVHNINEHRFLFTSLIYALHIPLLMGVLRGKEVLKRLEQNKLGIIPWIMVWMVVVYALLHFGTVGYILGLVPLGMVFVALGVRGLAPAALGVLFVPVVMIESVFFLTGMGFQATELRHINNRTLRAHDARIESYVKTVRTHDAETTLVIALRGQYLAEDESIQSYPFDDIRILEYYLPEYTIYDLLGVPEVYHVAYQHHYERKTGPEVPMSPTIKHVVFLADYIHPTIWPIGATLKASSDQATLTNVYTGKLDDSEMFFQAMRFYQAPTGDL